MGGGYASVVEMISKDWRSVRNGAYFYIELYWDIPQPVTSRYPTLLIDGVEYEAIFSDDRKVLRTAVPVMDAASVKEVATPEMRLLSYKYNRGENVKKKTRGNELILPGWLHLTHCLQGSIMSFATIMIMVMKR